MITILSIEPLFSMADGPVPTVIIGSSGATRSYSGRQNRQNRSIGGVMTPTGGGMCGDPAYLPTVEDPQGLQRLLRSAELTAYTYGESWGPLVHWQPRSMWTMTFILKFKAMLG